MGKNDLLGTLFGYQVDEGDFICFNNEEMEVLTVTETDDLDEIIVRAYSHTTGLTDNYPLFADEEYEVWGA